MPKTKSAKKALRQGHRRFKQNTSRKNELKTVVKRYRNLLQDGKKEEAQVYLATVYKKFDKMAKAGLIKKGKARRVKSRFSKKLK
ncbi:MAG: 30S ribosomal protein S20 [Patescibacteria group bacterium]